MEKLAGPASSSSRKSPAPSSEVPSSNSSPKPAATMDNSSSTSSAAQSKINIKPASVTPPPSSENPLLKLGGQASSTITPSAVRADPTGVLGKRTRAELDMQTPSSAPARKPTPAAEEPIEVYESRILSHIFRITLDPEQKTDAAHHKLIYLPELRKELEEEGGEVRLTAGNLDAAILEAAATIPKNKPV